MRAMVNMLLATVPAEQIGMVRVVCAIVHMPMPAQVRVMPAELVLSVMESIRNVNVEAIMIGAVWLANVSRSFSLAVLVPVIPGV